MPTENELEELTNDFLDGTMRVKGVDLNGKTEQVKVVGTLAVNCGIDCMSGDNILQS